MRPLLNAGHDPAEYVAIARAVGVDPYELLAQAENEVGGRRRRIDLTLCSHPVDGRSRRKAAIGAVVGRAIPMLAHADAGEDRGIAVVHCVCLKRREQIGAPP